MKGMQQYLASNDIGIVDVNQHKSTQAGSKCMHDV